MTFTETSLKGAFVIELEKHEDERIICDRDRKYPDFVT
jgi:dTDP-4-dehydrorhamnose 3,5-epimerase-like enzyme